MIICNPILRCRSPFAAFYLLLALFLLASTAVQADQLRLDNGDIVRGSDVRVSDGKVTIESASFGNLEVAQDRVQSIQTDERVWIIFRDEGKVKGRITIDSFGGMILRTDGLGQGKRFGMSALEVVAPGNLDPDKARTMWESKGGLNLGANFASGNDDYEQIHGDGRFVARRLNTRYTVRGEADYRKEDGEETVKKALLQGKHDLFFTDTWFFYTSVGFEHDASKQLDLRTDISTGAGYQVYETARTDLSFEGGLSYVIEEYDTGNSESYPAVRLATNFRYDPWLDKIELFHTNEFFQDLTGDNGYTARTRTGMRYFVTERINATAQVNYDWESETVAGQEEADTVYLFTLGYTW